MSALRQTGKIIAEMKQNIFNDDFMPDFFDKNIKKYTSLQEMYTIEGI